MPPRETERRPPDWQDYLAAYERAWRQHQDDPTPRTLRRLEQGEAILIRELFKPGRVALGQLTMTPGARDALVAGGHIPPEFLLRHKHGDWGEVDAEDQRANERALLVGSRLLSAYRTRLDDRLWVITEADRSVTTLLVPEDY
jgi:hypothetical protein